MKHHLARWLFSEKFPKLHQLYHAVNIFPKPFKPTPSDRILVLAPHPDDESIGCGGLLLKYGSQVDVVCLTDGRRGDKTMAEADVAEIRRQEFQSAMQKAKVNTSKMLDIPDRELIQHQTIFNQQVSLEAYDYIALPNNLDQHKDHRAVMVLLLKAIKILVHKPTVQFLFYEVWSALPLPNAYIDISEITQQKRDLINIYASQTKLLDYAEKILALNTYRGIVHNIAAAEVYSVVDKATFLKLS